MDFGVSPKPRIERNSALLAEIAIIEMPEVGTLLLYAACSTLAIIILSSLGLVAFRREVTEAQSRSLLSKVIYFAFATCIAILGITSFGTLLYESHLGGYALLIHVATAGAFVFLLTAVAWLFLPNGSTPEQRGYTRDERWWFARWTAFGLIISGVATAATMFTSMLPILDTQGLLEFAMLHRYAGLLTLVFAVLHGYSLVCTHFNWR